MKPVYKVILIIATLVFAFLIWALFFNDGGVLQTGWNSVADTVNTTWQTVTGGESKLLPSFGDAGVITDGTDLGGAKEGF